MPTSILGCASKNLSTSPRLSLRRSTTWPLASTAWTWKKFLAMSRPMVVGTTPARLFTADGSFRSKASTAPGLAHRCRSGAVPHQQAAASRHRDPGAAGPVARDPAAAVLSAGAQNGTARGGEADPLGTPAPGRAAGPAVAHLAGSPVPRHWPQ